MRHCHPASRAVDRVSDDYPILLAPGPDELWGPEPGATRSALAVRQRLLDGRASLNLSLSDPLGLARQSSITQGRGFVESGNQQATTRRASLSFSYNFGTGSRRAGGGGGGGARGGGGGR